MAQQADHTGHRSRLKDRYKREGLEHFQPHNVLELLLFYGIPYKDTNDTAHLLIDRFGSLEGVLEAPLEELVKVHGVGENTAMLLRLVRDIRIYEVRARNQSVRYIRTTQEAVAYLEREFYGAVVEKLIVLCLDNSDRIICCDTVETGTVNYNNINIRKVAEAIFRHNTSRVVFAHNHPKGRAEPSMEDIEFTATMRNMLATFGIQTRDHMIIGDGCYCSMREAEMTKYMF
ncbi:MAG: DNA repair protein RadC [Clostridiales bacterium]|nr:DNA repair protein RadC [Clostridiales bacterium]